MHKCHQCAEEAELKLVVEAGWAELCEPCAEEFWKAFFKAEAEAEGDR